MLAPDVADDHADVADRDLDQRHLLDLHEPRVQVPRTGQQHFFLQTAAAARVDERLSALKALVAGHDRAGEIAGGDGTAVERGHDTDALRLHLIDAQIVGRHAGLRRVGRGHDLEECRVDAVRAGGQHRELTAAFASAREKRFGVLEVVARHRFAEHMLVRHRGAVGGHDQRDFTGAHDDSRHFDHAVPPAPESEVPAGRQQPRLIPRLAVERDDAPRRERGTEAFHDQARLVRGNHPGAAENRDGDGQHERRNRQSGPPIFEQQIQHRFVLLANMLAFAMEDRCIGRTGRFRAVFRPVLREFGKRLLLRPCCNTDMRCIAWTGTPPPRAPRRTSAIAGHPHRARRTRRSAAGRVDGDRREAAGAARRTRALAVDLGTGRASRARDGRRGARRLRRRDARRAGCDRHDRRAARGAPHAGPAAAGRRSPRPGERRVARGGPSGGARRADGDGGAADRRNRHRQGSDRAADSRMVRTARTAGSCRSTARPFPTS